jgi:hypothetical protein
MAVAMYGPAFTKSGQIVNRMVPEADVAAFENAGYVKGTRQDLPNAPTEEELQAEQEAADATSETGNPEATTENEPPKGAAKGAKSKK